MLQTAYNLIAVSGVNHAPGRTHGSYPRRCSHILRTNPSCTRTSDTWLRLSVGLIANECSAYLRGRMCNKLTLQSMHLLPYGLTLPLLLDPACPGLRYGEAFARAERSLFSPILRVAAAGREGSVVASVETF